MELDSVSLISTLSASIVFVEAFAMETKGLSHLLLARLHMV